MSDKAAAYDARYPGVNIPEAQKTERMERLEFKEELRAGRRTSRTRGIIVPALPWKENQ